MKANQAFKAADEAVSPVIGVILMVAITVVLAAVVFVLVTKLSSDQSDDAPDVGFSVNESEDQIRVAQNDAGLRWCDFQVAVDWTDGMTDYTGAGFFVNAGPGAANIDDDSTFESMDPSAACTTGTVSAGDFVEFCIEFGGATTQYANAQVRIIHTESNAAIYEHTFASLQDCA